MSINILLCDFAIGADILHGGDGMAGSPPALHKLQQWKQDFPNWCCGAVKHIVVMVAAGEPWTQRVVLLLGVL